MASIIINQEEQQQQHAMENRISLDTIASSFILTALE
jgi:hypothetical protein